jgi:hypothetical protein
MVDGTQVADAPPQGQRRREVRSEARSHGYRRTSNRLPPTAYRLPV